MGRGRSSSSGGSRGSSFSSSSRGRSSSSSRGRIHTGGHHTTVIIGGHHHSHGRASKASVISGGIVCLVIGVIVLIASICGVVDANKYASVKGTCLKNEYSGGWYYTTYEYVVKGKNYVNRSNEGWEFPEDVGKTVTIYYEKDNPNNITEEKPGMGGGVLLAVSLIGLTFTTIGVICIVNGIKMKREEEIAEGYSNSSTSSSSVEEKFTTCAYCGSKYKSELSSCPKCGAGK